ncbi:MAG TPA: 3-hydroxyacyl-CoA dehydrogenase NAD-binding domain-containing protein [Vicinamibacteria bacterium]|nr:3-hydroxyacyl-CoA dehydrogenase NAD-binding domain-containing protein [Vicinamibacteria bacterium]
MASAAYTRRDSVALITLDNPPVNGLSHDLRRGILEGLDRALADPGLKAVVLAGAGRQFSAGADIREFGTPRMTAEPTLHTVIHAVESSPKPVIAALHGVAMGGGLELALACHYRVAAAGAQVALPEVKLGLLPGAGGTQRLPRAVGLETALNMIVSGATVPAAGLTGTRLLDEEVEGDLAEAAVAFATKVADRRPLPLLRDLAVDHPGAEGFLAFARAAVGAASKGYPAPLRCLEALAAAARQPFEQGLRTERDLFVSLLHTPESSALRHAFFAERAASRIRDVPEDTPVRAIRLAAVVGAGTMGTGIAMSFASAGIPVTVLEADRARLDKGMEAIRKSYESGARKGRITAAQAQERLSLVHPTLSYADLAPADIVIEAVFEDMAVKQGVFKTLDATMKPGAILATNTSTLDVDALARATRRPADVVGTHFFSPAHVMRLLEVVRGEATGKDVLATVMALARTIRKTAVVSGVCDGFIGNRMLEQYLRQALFLLEEGALPAQVDRALEEFGMAMGPFRMSDLAGNDVGWYVRKRRYVEQPGLVYPHIADRICEQGRFGQKTGAGWYRYEAGRRDAIPDPAVDEMVVASSREKGITRRRIADGEIVERCVLALVNEGAKVLEEGIAQRASDVDVVYLAGYGFPPYRGGPLFHADTVGLFTVERRMKAFAEGGQGDPAFWTPAPLLARLAAEGGTFNAFNAPRP